MPRTPSIPGAAARTTHRAVLVVLALAVIFLSGARLVDYLHGGHLRRDTRAVVKQANGARPVSSARVAPAPAGPPKARATAPVRMPPPRLLAPPVRSTIVGRPRVPVADRRLDLRRKLELIVGGHGRLGAG